MTAVGRRMLAFGECGTTVSVTVGDITADLSAGTSGSGMTLVAGGENWAGLQLIMLTITNPLNISRFHLSLMAGAIPSFCDLNVSERFVRFVAYLRGRRNHALGSHFTLTTMPISIPNETGTLIGIDSKANTSPLRFMLPAQCEVWACRRAKCRRPHPMSAS